MQTNTLDWSFKVIHSKKRNQYSVILVSECLDKMDDVRYLKYRKNDRIVFFNNHQNALNAIEQLSNTEFSLYYMGS